MTTLAFDVYGTLIDTNGVYEKLQTYVGDHAGEFSRRWRNKQLEYAFRRGLMQNYCDFATCTEQALVYVDAELATKLSAEQRQALSATYRQLPAFDDARASLQALKERQVAMYAFSNGSANAVQQLLEHADLTEFFTDVVSTDEMQSFKPNPGVYSHFLRRANASHDQAWLISSNSFDVIGARSAGMQAAWIKRDAHAVYDPWGIEPTITVSSLAQLTDKLN
ncbi:2-haloacid dehalogenase [Pseudidiomarina planktonica]|uniref:(S)-2-haloacid dehalogenase n=1 Tax=Pseudidiomarina planktonica TaxID=1323738 RepID=A0A1Y6ETF8_9GAMM|nr:haloacid dehalogenase type II [Pseudidiomarina planktonica]RUO65249.1 haloacid dehalogenase type II [Pseudidiomarina planktonica]SMQ65827.1 2-haloacid dehalogenase [Pseudidiomarina planktonica]